MLDKELKRLNDNPEFYDLYAKGIEALTKAGVFNVLRLLGQPDFVFEGKDQVAMAAQAARSVGWNDAIRTLLNFEALIDIAITPKTNPNMNYGGLEAAVRKGDILPGEVDDIQHGRKPSYPTAAASTSGPSTATAANTTKPS